MNRPVNIQFALNGFLVQCGCQIIVFNQREDLLKHLDSYLQDPGKTEKDFVAGAVNRKITYLGYPAEAPTEIGGAQGIRGYRDTAGGYRDTAGGYRDTAGGYRDTADAPRTPYPEPTTCCGNAVG